MLKIISVVFAFQLLGKRFLSRGHNICLYIYIATHEHSPKDPTQRIVQTRSWFYVFLPVGMIEIHTD